MPGISLSICIPIYNCAEFIGTALDSILPQTDVRVEVIIYDGGSTDGTSEIIAKYLEIWPNLKYTLGKTRGGIDIDMVKCTDLAVGEYIWLFSGDDVMRENAIEKAFSWMRSREDVYLCEHSICDRDMRPLRAYPMLMPNVPTHVDFSNPASREAWFKSACTTEPFFSFMSSLLVRKDKWDSGKLDEKFVGSCWGHVARLFGLISTGLRVCYVAEVWLDMRGGNDSFLDKGVVNRFSLAIDGYHKIADTFFGHNSIEAFHIRRVIRNEFTLRMFMHTKVLCIRNPKIESIALLDRLVNSAYSDGSFRERINHFFYRFPVWTFTLARFVHRSTVLTAQTIGLSRK